MSDDRKEEAGAADEADSASSLLYDDVDAASSSPSSLLAVKHAYDLQQLRAELAEARRLQQETAAQLERKEAECAQYTSQCAVLARNVSLLYATAVSEVKRKNDEIDRLQAWKAAKERRERQRREDDQQQQQQEQRTTAAVQRPPAPPPLQPPARPASRLPVPPTNSVPTPQPPFSILSEPSGSLKQGRHSQSPSLPAAAAAPPLVSVNWQR